LQQVGAKRFAASVEARAPARHGGSAAWRFIASTKENKTAAIVARKSFAANTAVITEVAPRGKSMSFGCQPAELEKTAAWQTG